MEGTIFTLMAAYVVFIDTAGLVLVVVGVGGAPGRPQAGGAGEIRGRGEGCLRQGGVEESLGPGVGRRQEQYCSRSTPGACCQPEQKEESATLGGGGGEPPPAPACSLSPLTPALPHSCVWRGIWGSPQASELPPYKPCSLQRHQIGPFSLVGNAGTFVVSKGRIFSCLEEKSAPLSGLCFLCRRI